MPNLDFAFVAGIEIMTGGAAIRPPSGLKATSVQSQVRASVRNSSQVDASHIFTVPSVLPVARSLPSELNAILLTTRLCPRGAGSSFQVAVSQTLIDGSPPETSLFPFGLNTRL